MPTPTPAAIDAPDSLESAILTVERHLQSLAQALLDRDGPAVADRSTDLQRALQRTLSLSSGPRRAALPPALSRRLKGMAAEVAAQRESLGRASAALHRAMNVLLPAAPSDVYAEPGRRRT